MSDPEPALPFDVELAVRALPPEYQVEMAHYVLDGWRIRHGAISTPLWVASHAKNNYNLTAFTLLGMLETIQRDEARL